MSDSYGSETSTSSEPIKSLEELSLWATLRSRHASEMAIEWLAFNAAAVALYIFFVPMAWLQPNAFDVVIIGAFVLNGAGAAAYEFFLAGKLQELGHALK